MMFYLVSCKRFSIDLNEILVRARSSEMLLLHLKAKKATYKTANEFAIEVGEILSKALGASISADKLPDGKCITISLNAC